METKQLTPAIAWTIGLAAVGFVFMIVGMTQGPFEDKPFMWIAVGSSFAGFVLSITCLVGGVKPGRAWWWPLVALNVFIFVVAGTW